MKGLAAKLLMGAGILALGAGTSQKSLAGPLDYLDNRSFTNVIYDEGNKNSEVSIKKAIPSFIIKYDSELYLPEESVGRLLNNYYERYKKEIDEDLWLRMTDSLMGFNEAYALMIKESSGNNHARSLDGSIGPWQPREDVWNASSINESKYPFEKYATNINLNQIAVAENMNFFVNYLKENHPFWNELSKEDRLKYLLSAHQGGQATLKSRKWDINRMGPINRDLIHKVFNYVKYLEDKDKHEEYLAERESHKKIGKLNPIKPAKINLINSQTL